MSEFYNISSDSISYSLSTSEIEDIKNKYILHGSNSYQADEDIQYAEKHYTKDNVYKNIIITLDTDHVLHFRGMDNMKELYKMHNNKGDRTTTQWLELKNILFTYNNEYKLGNEYNEFYFKNVDNYRKIIYLKLNKFIKIDENNAYELIINSYHSRIVAFLDYMQELHSGNRTIHTLKERFFGHSNKDIFKKINKPRNENYIITPIDGIHAARVSLGTLVVNVTNIDDTAPLKEEPMLVTKSFLNNMHFLKKNTKVAVYN